MFLVQTSSVTLIYINNVVGFIIFTVVFVSKFYFQDFFLFVKHSSAFELFTKELRCVGCRGASVDRS